MCKECWITQSQCYSSYPNFKNFPMGYYSSPALLPPKQKLATLVPVIVPTTTQARSNSPNNVNVGSPSHMTSSPPPVTASNGRIPINNVESIFSKNTATDFISYSQLQPTTSEHSTWVSEASQSGQPTSPCTPLMTSAACQSLDVPPPVMIQVQANNSSGSGDTLPGPEEFEKYLNASDTVDAMGLVPPPVVTSLSSAHPRYHSDAYYGQQPASGFVAHNNCS